MKEKAMSTIKRFISSALGAALGTGLFLVITDPLAFGQIVVDSTLIAMAVFGLVFGLISTVVHSRRLPTFISCLLCGVASVLLVAGTIAGLTEGHRIVIATAADVLLPVGATFVLALLIGLGGWLGMRIAAEH
jgi:hypothetical protein